MPLSEPTQDVQVSLALLLNDSRNRIPVMLSSSTLTFTPTGTKRNVNVSTTNDLIDGTLEQESVWITLIITRNDAVFQAREDATGPCGP